MIDPQIAEKFGLWAALTLMLIGSMVWLLKFLLTDVSKTLKEINLALTVHAASCENGQRKGCERGHDVDAIGKSVEKLVNVLTMKRRADADDANGPR